MNLVISALCVLLLALITSLLNIHFNFYVKFIKYAFSSFFFLYKTIFLSINITNLFLYFLPLICPHLCPFWRGNTRSHFLCIISPYWICFCQLQQFWTQKTQETPKACNHTAGISLCRTQFVTIYPLKGCSFFCVSCAHVYVHRKEY